MIIIEFIVAVIAIGGILSYAGSKLGKKSINKATELVLRLDEHYDSYIEKHKTLLLLENSGGENAALLTDRAMKQRIEDAFCILKPEVDALIGYINSTNRTDGKILTQPRFFRNVAAITEALFEKRRTTGGAITERDEEKVYAAVKEAILSDLKERALNWKIGNI